MFLGACAAFAWPYGDPSLYATNRDGSALYFSSSLRMQGTTQYFHPKIFVWEVGQGLRLYEQRASDVPAAALAEGWVGSEYFYLRGVEISSDGSTVALIGQRACTSTACWGLERYRTTVYQRGRPAVNITGVAALSRNGRYAAPSSDPVSTPSLVIDLETGQRTSYTGWPVSTSRPIANDGTVLMSGGAGLAVTRAGQTTNLGISSGAAWINAAATTVIYSDNTQLAAYSIATRKSTVLAGQLAGQVVMSDDASLIAVAGPGPSPQVHIVRGDGSGSRQLTNFQESVRPVAMSGDGKFVFAVTGDWAANRIVRIDTASGAWTEVVPATPLLRVDSPVLLVWPGTLATFPMLDLGQETIEAQEPLPTALGGVEMRVNGNPAPVASLSGEGIRFQVPWELPQGYSELEMHGPYLTASPFVAGAMLAPAQPAFFIRRDGKYGVIAAAHEDFSDLVSLAKPAVAGEVVHLYARGVGPVSVLPSAGESTPLEPLSRTLLPPVCTLPIWNSDNGTTWQPVDVPAEVLFAGLAPGMMGIYQIDVRLPAEIRGGGVGSLRCVTGGETGKAFTGYLPI